ncbi:hypothetical protein BB561_000349 [Smittium simulii]|uniref:Uncharacterized protein n=1 Tax=Smittium simulii TaxID=133385 RepID=A0A2T9YZF2_9FUNG|nr:hypothetical protein BB561_000349 [Smittium simulii]
MLKAENSSLFQMTKIKNLDIRLDTTSVQVEAKHMGTQHTEITKKSLPASNKFGNSEKKGRLHPHYKKACNILSQLASLNNLGPWINKSLQEINYEKELAQFQPDQNEYTSSAYDFGPSTPQSPGYFYGNTEDSTENTYELDQKNNPESDSQKIIQEPTLYNNINRIFEKFEFDMSDFLLYKRNDLDGLPIESIFLENKNNFSKKIFRILEVICYLIKVVYIPEIDIEAYTHSAVRHLIFFHLIEFKSPSFDTFSIFNKTLSASNNNESILSSTKENSYNISLLSNNENNIHYSRFLYHNWIIRSFYREKLITFHHNKKLSDSKFTDSLSVHYSCIDKFLNSELAMEFCLSDSDLALYNYDLARFKFALNDFKLALKHFQISKKLDVTISNQKGFRITRILGEESTVIDYISTCTLLIDDSGLTIGSQRESTPASSARNSSQSFSETDILNSKSIRKKNSDFVFKTINFSLEENRLIEECSFNNEIFSSLQNIHPIPLVLNTKPQFNYIDYQLDDQYQASDHLQGLLKSDSIKISFCSWVLSMFSHAMKNLLADNYTVSSHWFEYIYNHCYKNNNSQDFISNSNNKQNINTDVILGVLAQSKAYMHISKALNFLQILPNTIDQSEYNSYLQEINNHIKTALDYKYQLDELNSNLISETPLLFLALEKVALSTMRLGLQKSFVSIVEKIAINPGLYQQLPEKNMSVLNVVSGLFYLKTLLSQSKVMGFKDLKDFKANLGKIYNSNLFCNLLKSSLGDIRTHFFRVLNSLILLSNNSESFFNDFYYLLSCINDGSLCLLLAGFINGVLISQLIEEKYTDLLPFESYGVLSYFFFSKTTIDKKFELTLLTPEFKLFLLQNTPPSVADIQLPTNYSICSKQSDVELLNFLFKNENIKLSGISDFYIKIILCLNIHILKIYPECIPTIMNISDIGYFLLSTEHSYDLQQKKNLNFIGDKTHIQKNNSKNKFLENNYSKKIKDPNNSNYCNADTGILSKYEIDNSGLIEISYMEMYASNFIEFLSCVSHEFNPVNLLAIFISDSSISDLTCLSGFNYYIPFNNYPISLKDLTKYIRDFKNDKKNEIELIKNRIGLFISYLIEIKLYVAVTALYQYLAFESKYINDSFVNEKVEYSKIFNVANQAVDLGQINPETSQFFWDFVVIQQIQYYINKKCKNLKLSGASDNSYNNNFQQENILSINSDIAANADSSDLNNGFNSATLQKNNLGLISNKYKVINKNFYDSFGIRKNDLNCNEAIANGQISQMTSNISSINYKNCNFFEFQQQLDQNKSSGCGNLNTRKMWEISSMIRLKQELSLTEVNIKTAVARTCAFGKRSGLRTWISDLIKCPYKNRCDTWKKNDKSQISKWIADTESGTGCNWMGLELVYPELKTHINYVFKIRNGTYWTARRYAKSGFIEKRFIEECPFCRNIAPETIEHMLLECSLWQALRANILAQYISIYSAQVATKPPLLPASISMRLVYKLLGEELKLPITGIHKNPTVFCIKTILSIQIF